MAARKSWNGTTKATRQTLSAHSKSASGACLRPSPSGSFGADVAIAPPPSADWKSPSEGEKRPQPLKCQPLRGLLSVRQGFPIPERNGCGRVKRPTS